MKLYLQTRLGKDGLSDFRIKLRKETGVSMREIKNHGFYGVYSRYEKWRYKNITLMRNRETGGYFAEDGRSWSLNPCPVISLNEYKSKAAWDRLLGNNHQITIK